MTTNQPQKNILNDWQLIPVGDIFTFVKTYAFSRDNLSMGVLSAENIGNIHYGDIHSTYASKNIDVSKIEIPIVKDINFIPKKEDLLKNGDIVMADASEDYEGVGVTITMHGINKNNVIGGLHTYVLRDQKGKTTEYYRQYIFSNPLVRNKLQKIANGVSVYGISKVAVSKVNLPLPPLPEQKRIVQVLETWDYAIEALNKKIEHKKKIKKGLMQELLTGKRRLPGFNDEWNTIKLQDICSIIMGQSPPSVDYNETSRGIPLIQGNNDIKNRKTRPRVWTTQITKTGKKGDIIMTVRAPVGRIGVATTNICIGRGVCVIRAIKVDRNYILKCLENFENRWKSFEQGSTFTAVNSKDIKSLPLIIPKSKKEQTAIAIALGASDREIEQLERKLSIVQDQKKYLLNNLITGTLRTPETIKIKKK